MRATTTISTSADGSARRAGGLTVPRVFSDEDGPGPYDGIEWEERTASIRDEKGVTVFEQHGVEVPKGWSQLATNVVASKYFYGDAKAGNGSPADGGREHSVRQLVWRVARTIADWGREDGCFATDDDAERFHDELSALCLGQYGSFNSPVWFNVGLHLYGVEGDYEGFRWCRESGRPVPVKPGDAYRSPQASACFIVGVEDSIASIYDRATVEGRVFKYGSGSGSNNSSIRSGRELVRGGGRPSGPLSFMQVYDAVAKVTKSGGKTRRAAKMEILDDWHPDILEFVRCKGVEEAKAHALIREGYPADYNGDAYGTVCFQNSNLSVRFSDAFMRKVSGDDPDKTWRTRAVTTGTHRNGNGDEMPAYDADALFTEVAAGTWRCGDPGVQFSDTINRWNTVKEFGPIRASNPCCFVGETLVRTSEGKLSIAMLAEMDRLGLPLPMAFAFDFEKGVPVLRRINHAWKAGDASRLVEVKTDKGLAFRCTPEHRFYLRNGEAVEARDLTPGMRLRKISRSTIGKTRRRSIETKKGTFYQARWMYEQAHGPIPEGFEVHHVNGDRWDDRLSNLALVEKDRHRREHAAGAANARYIDCPESLLVETWEAVEAVALADHRRGCTVTPARWNSHVRANGLRGTVPLANSRGIRGMSWGEFRAWVDERRALVNDVVASVESVDPAHPVAVYDIEVEGVHNFEIGGIDAKHGVVVSNSEFLHPDDTACNLASLNLLKFRTADGGFDADQFAAAVRIFIIAQEILVDRAGYPTEAICRNSHELRPLGLGYANLGALLMSCGLPYDSDDARQVAGLVTAFMHGVANATSSELAAVMGPFPAHEANSASILGVMRSHREAADWIAAGVEPKATGIARDLAGRVGHLWHVVVADGRAYGFRNAQVTLLAPTGTIAFMMDCDTTGVEPELALVKRKLLAGGGSMKLVNRTVEMALATLGYPDSRAAAIRDHIDAHGHIEGAPGLDPAHLPVFDCSFPSGPSGRAVHYMGHLRMMAAVQPFLSGAISKTCNMPESSTVEDIKAAYLEAWRLGLKCVAIYRDGSKGSQPLTSGDKPKAETPGPAPAPVPSRPTRERLPTTRRSITHKFDIQGHEGYVNVGLYPDGRPGELFITMAKEGSTVGGLMDVLGTSISIGLQYGVPPEVFVNKFAHVRFEPAGFTKNPDIPIAKSIADYIFRWIGMEFVKGYREADAPRRDAEAPAPVAATAARPSQDDSPACPDCGGITVRAGTCYACIVCGSTTGCS